jgi:pyruvate/2-oxoglutarate dehydrogenase complex dihydrolipoamide dehydrogenase (E3) component
VSFDDFIRDNLAGGNRTTGDRLVPHYMFTDPRLAHVGLTEKEARRQGIEVRVAKLPMSVVLSTQTTGETKGFMKHPRKCRLQRLQGRRPRQQHLHRPVPGR